MVVIVFGLIPLYAGLTLIYYINICMSMTSFYHGSEVFEKSFGCPTVVKSLALGSSSPPYAMASQLIYLPCNVPHPWQNSRPCEKPFFLRGGSFGTGVG